MRFASRPSDPGRSSAASFRRDRLRCAVRRKLRRLSRRRRQVRRRARDEQSRIPGDRRRRFDAPRYRRRSRGHRDAAVCKKRGRLADRSSNRHSDRRHPQKLGRHRQDAGTGAPPYSGSAGNPNNGSQVYAANCQSCHGADGKGGPKAGSIVNPSYLVTRQRPKSPHDRNRRASRARPSRLEERRRRATADARAGLRRGRMAGLETSRLTAGPE